ncbi:MAG: aminotransferase class IV [Bdellovibrionales bacterium]|nr:aminotransferase class IV [Bdellovibrionales bacterium]
MSLVYVNGVVTKPEDAMISVYDRGFLFGDAIYEVTRSYGKILFSLEAHIDRLYRSADAIQLNIGIPKDAFIKQVYDFYKKENNDDIYVRIQISRGNVKKEQISLFPENFDQANVVMYLHPLKPFNQALYTEGQRLVHAGNFRNPKKSLDPNIKSGNYLNNIIALLNIDKEKYSDSFLLNDEGFVTEGTTFNIFYVKDGVVVTSPDESDILLGITRNILLEESGKQGITIVKKNFTLEDLYSADEVFTTSSTKEVMPVSYVDDQKIASGMPGEITKKLSAIYKENIKKYLDWATINHPWK